SASTLVLPHASRFFFSSRRRHTRSKRDWSSDVCSSDLGPESRSGAGRRHQIGFQALGGTQHGEVGAGESPAQFGGGGQHRVHVEIGRASCRERGWGEGGGGGVGRGRRGGEGGEGRDGDG